MDADGRTPGAWTEASALDPAEIRQELEEIRQLLGHDS